MTDSAVDDGSGPVLLTSNDLATIAEPSRPFVGQWHTLVSQTNWEKGRLICEWRERMADAGVAPRLYSDPAWSRMVGEVSPQHVGRLRRTWKRFGDVQASYTGLYWSHFLAALDWHDAEMWLEGSVQNDWSVSQMRFQRWEATGAVAEDRPDPLEIVSTPDDEGVQVPPRLDATPANPVRRDELKSVEGPVYEGPDFGDDDRAPAEEAPPAATDSALSGSRVDLEQILDELPSDIVKPFRALREAVSRLRERQWEGVKRIHLVALVNELRELLRRQPTEDPGPSAGN